MMDFLPSAFRPGGRDRIKSIEDGATESTYRQPTGHTSQAMALGEDKLATFRHLVGIHSTRAPGPNPGGLPQLSFDGRVAPNLGMYNRVVHREQQAKKSYRFASIMINSCLGIQIIVAAALTALGAANSSHRAVTAFGAINTVIAGMLTYLKGSGLPNRIKYYENEWKRVREYIEQRERDFSRPDCNIDVYETVKIIEAMYEEVKADVQTNTPDSYVSVGDIRARAAASTHPIPKLPKVGEVASGHEGKLRELEMKYGPKVAEFLSGLAHKEEDRLRSFGRTIEDHKNDAAKYGEKIGRELDSRRDRLIDLEKDLERDFDTKRAKLSDLERDIERGIDVQRNKVSNLEKDVERGLDAQRAKVSDLEEDIERGVDEQRARVSNFEKDAEKEAAERRNNFSRIGQELKDEMRLHRRE